MSLATSMYDWALLAVSHQLYVKFAQKYLFKPDRKIAQRPETRPSTSSSSSPLSFSSSFSRSKYNRATFFFSIILTTRINTRTILRTSYGYQNFYFYFDSDSSNDLINSGFNLRFQRSDTLGSVLRSIRHFESFASLKWQLRSAT